MSGDYSRQRFGSLKDYSGVLMQQGRVQLDADWNELVDIIDRRVRAGTLDSIGFATVPKQTPDAFKVTLVGGVANIGPGRMYVDGLLAENHGKRHPDPAHPDHPIPEFDAHLAELRGPDPLPYTEQPYFPSAATASPFPTSGGPHLVYLDVWQREVTFLEDQDLVEKAVGVDSTTRYQTAWQVRVLAGIGEGVTCDSPDSALHGWSDVISPSAGRLTTAAVGVAEEDDPCLTPPSGGFKGLENRLYRVEIHDKGPHAGATFKWSRENASVATAVTAIPDAHNLVVARVGRDAVLRFNPGDWIEVTDDFRELEGLPGMMALIQGVNDATRTITLTGALPAGTFPVNAQGQTDPARHTRIRRWDQKGQVTDTNGNPLVDLDAPGSAGTIPVPADGISIILEDGVQITFSTQPAGGDFRTGDYWTFAARTADASVEELREAPPRGVHHHYARLAIVTLPGDITDCRTLWPPDFGDIGCDCTICLTPEGGGPAIQAAIDQLKAEGATICLGPGLYNLGRQPLRITAAQALRIKGHGWKTQLVYFGAGPAIQIENSLDVTLEDLSILTSGVERSGGSAITARNVAGLVVQHGVILQLGGEGTFLPAIGLAGIIGGAYIRENVILAAVGIGNVGGGTTPEPGPRLAFLSTRAARALGTLGLFIEENFLVCRARGVSLDGATIHTGQTRIADNFVAQGSEVGIVDLGITSPGAGVEISGNSVQTRGAGIGIAAGSDGARIAGNFVTNQGRTAGDGILLAAPRGDGIDRAQVVNNCITGVGGNGIALRGSVRTLMIKQNVLQATGGGIVMNEEASAVVLDVEDNQLLDIAPTSNDQEEEVAAIRVVRASHATITNNTVIGAGAQAVQSPLRAGIHVLGPSLSMQISGNEVADVGPPDQFVKEAMGIAYAGPFDRLQVSSNRVRRGQNPPEGGSPSNWMALQVTGATTAAERNTIAGGANVLFMLGDRATFSVFRSRIVRLPTAPGNLTVQANQLDSYGQAETVRILTSGACTFSNNQCVLTGPGRFPVGRIVAGAIMASGNYMQGPGDVALGLSVPNAAPFAVMGNVCQGRIQINGSDLPAPWGALNIPAA